MKRITMTGQRYGQLIVVTENGKYVEAVCECGVQKRYYRTNVLTGYTQSCGCLQKQRTSIANKTHGFASSPTYTSWKAMKQRCTNFNRGSAHRYAERGILYDARWERFENFLDDMGERPEGTELDRIDNNKGYSKDNCRWTTHQVNCQNKGY